MPSLNMQTDREVRYEQRCFKKKCDQQNTERDERVTRRDMMKNEIRSEVSDEISELSQKKKVVTTTRSGRTVVSSFLY